jgi:hypothetical protein
VDSVDLLNTVFLAAGVHVDVAAVGFIIILVLLTNAQTT